MTEKATLNYINQVIINPGTAEEAHYDDLYLAEKRKRGKNLYLVKKHSKWGCIDAAGKMVIPLEYDHLLHLQTLLIATKNGLTGIIDYHGRTLYPFKDAQLHQQDVEQLDRGEDIHGAIIFKKWDGTLTLQGIAEYPSGKLLLTAGPYEILRRDNGFLVKVYKYQASKNDLYHPSYRFLDFGAKELAVGEDMYQLGINIGLI